MHHRRVKLELALLQDLPLDALLLLEFLNLARVDVFVDAH
jgi:hypothetical protein